MSFSNVIYDQIAGTGFARLNQLNSQQEGNKHLVLVRALRLVSSLFDCPKSTFPLTGLDAE